MSSLSLQFHLNLAFPFIMIYSQTDFYSFFFNMSNILSPQNSYSYRSFCLEYLPPWFFLSFYLNTLESSPSFFLSPLLFSSVRLLQSALFVCLVIICHTHWNISSVKVGTIFINCPPSSLSWLSYQLSSWNIDHHGLNSLLQVIREHQFF